MADVKTLTINDITYNIKDEAARQSLADVVHKTGTETISGAKTFTSILHSVSPDSASNDDSVPTTEWVNNAISGGAVATDSNLSTWSTNFSNCIIQKPLNNIYCSESAGTSTTTKRINVSVGSKIYVPNGIGIFTEITISGEQSLTTIISNTDIDIYVFVNLSGTTLYTADREHIFTGESYTGGSSGIWYDTVNNTIRQTIDGGTTWSENLSFPIAVDKTITQGRLEIFDSIGFIGSILFVLPNVKFAKPNGRNSDGSCKNLIVTTTEVILTDTKTWANSGYFYIRGASGDNAIGYIEDGRFHYDYSMSITSGVHMFYSTLDNKIYKKSSSDTYYTEYDCAIIGYYNKQSQSVKPPLSFNIRPVPKVLDDMDLRSVLEMIYPVGSIYIGTQSTCPMEYVLQGTKWEKIEGDKVLQSSSTNHSAGSTIDAGLPNLKGYTGAAGDPGCDGVLFKNTFVGGRIHSGQGYQFRSFFDASQYNSIYKDNFNTVQPPAYVVNVWRRTK